MNAGSTSDGVAFPPRDTGGRGDEPAAGAAGRAAGAWCRTAVGGPLPHLREVRRHTKRRRNIVTLKL